MSLGWVTPAEYAISAVIDRCEYRSEKALRRDETSRDRHGYFAPVPYFGVTRGSPFIRYESSPGEHRFLIS